MSGRKLGTRDVLVAGVALVVASSTLVSEFTGYFQFGAVFLVALALGFGVNLLLACSAADLAVAFPKGSGLADYARAVLPGHRGVATFLGLAFFGMFALAVSGETASGAHALKSLTGLDLPIGTHIVALCGLAVLPNLFGVQSAAWVSLGLLVVMLGLRWFFGLAGFCGWGGAGGWSWANATGSGEVVWLGTDGVLASGLGLALWSFVGIEFACSLAGHVKNPGRSMPRGLIFGLLLILATSVLMGLGVSGSLPLGRWQELAAGEAGAFGEAPQLAVGLQLFGDTGAVLMAIASVTATLGSLVVAYAAMPAILVGLAENRELPGALSTVLARKSRRHGAPVAAILATAAIHLVPALNSADVVDWVFSAAYVWILLYAVFHLLSWWRLRQDAARGRGGPSRPWVAALGALATLVALGLAFQGGHVLYGGRALIVLGAAALVSAAARWTRPWNRFGALSRAHQRAGPSALRGLLSARPETASSPPLPPTDGSNPWFGSPPAHRAQASDQRRTPEHVRSQAQDQERAQPQSSPRRQGWFPGHRQE